MPPKSRLPHFEQACCRWDLCRMSKARLFTFVFALLMLMKDISGQTVLMPAHAVWQYAAGLAGSKQDAFGILRHPAMSEIPGLASLGFAGESMSGIPGTATLSAVAGIRSGGGVAGCVLDHRSMAGSGETRILFGYALPLSSSLRVGLRIGFQGFRVPSHRMISGLPIEWGLVYRQHRLSFGVAASHPVTLSSHRSHPGIPGVFRVTATYELSTGTGLALDVVREEGWGLSCRPMFFYAPNTAFRLTAGVIADKGSMFLGLRYQRSSLGFQMLFDRHPLLGWTGAFGIDHYFQGEVKK
jgi:hypothetical protein